MLGIMLMKSLLKISPATPLPLAQTGPSEHQGDGGGILKITRGKTLDRLPEETGITLNFCGWMRRGRSHGQAGQIGVVKGDCCWLSLEENDGSQRESLGARVTTNFQSRSWLWGWQFICFPPNIQSFKIFHSGSPKLHFASNEVRSENHDQYSPQLRPWITALQWRNYKETVRKITWYSPFSDWLPALIFDLLKAVWRRGRL